MDFNVLSAIDSYLRTKRETDGHKDRQKLRHRDWQADRQTDRQKGRHAGSMNSLE